MDTTEVCPQDGATLADKWGDPRPFDDEGPDMPKSKGWKADYSTFLLLFPPRTFPPYTLGPAQADLRTSPQIPGDSPGVLGQAQGGGPSTVDALFGGGLQEADHPHPSRLGQIQEMD